MNEPPHNKTSKLTVRPAPSGSVELLAFKTVFIIYDPLIRNEPPQDKTNKMACAPSEDSDQPGHPPSLIRAFTVRSMGS